MELADETGWFPGIYGLCIDMAEALTDWETGNGGQTAYENAGRDWVIVIEDLTDAIVEEAIRHGEKPNPHWVLHRMLKGKP